ncbi:MAG: hypothetical protein RBR08_06770 [Desulforegulaceae bacterium]|nr:hypothetical protein [Desulforegulaceae bacterium]
MSSFENEIFIWGKHKSFPDFIKISDNNKYLLEIEKVFDNSLYFSSLSSTKIIFYIFHKKKGFITGAVLQSMDSKLRNSPFLIGIRYKTINYLKKWNNLFLSGFQIFENADKIVNKEFDNINSFKKEAFATKKIRFSETFLFVSDDKIKKFVFENIKKEKENLNKQKLMVFKVEKEKKNDILKILYHIEKLTNITPFSFFLRENTNNFQLSFFYRKFSYKDLTNIWLS